MIGIYRELKSRRRNASFLLKGSGVLECTGSQPISISPGQAVVIPAAIHEALIRPQWELEFLKCMVPEKKFAEPETELVARAPSPA